MTATFPPIRGGGYSPIRGGVKEFLASFEDEDGVRHASYLTASRTLCGIPSDDPDPAGDVPTCLVCFETAYRFDLIDGSAPDHWREP